MNYQEIIETELKKNKVSLCSGQCGKEGHKRGFVCWDEPVIHMESKFTTRSTLYGFFHELGHAVSNHKHLRSYRRETQAERFASVKLKEYGIPVPRKCVALGKQYIARKKRHGDNIKDGQD